MGATLHNVNLAVSNLARPTLPRIDTNLTPEDIIVYRNSEAEDSSSSIPVEYFTDYPQAPRAQTPFYAEQPHPANPEPTSEFSPEEVQVLQFHISAPSIGTTIDSTCREVGHVWQDTIDE